MSEILTDETSTPSNEADQLQQNLVNIAEMQQAFTYSLLEQSWKESNGTFEIPALGVCIKDGKLIENPQTDPNLK